MKHSARRARRVLACPHGSPVTFKPVSTLRPKLLAFAVAQALAAPAMAATITVDNSSDLGTDSSCTLRQAIMSANADSAGMSDCAAGAGDDVIDFDPAVFPLFSSTTISPLSALPSITSNITINGHTPGGLTIAGHGFDIYLATVRLNNLVISGASRGIIAANSGIELNSSTISGSNVTGSGGGINFYYGSLSINNSTLSNNTSTIYGGALNAYNAVVEINNSTLSGNSASNGGAIFSYNDTVTITNSTITGNSASGITGGINAYGGGGALYLRNSIVAGNIAPVRMEINNEVGAVTITSQNNVLGDSSKTNFQAFYAFHPNASDITATSNGTQSTALGDILDSLADNGGGSLTHELAASSPALDNGDGALCINKPLIARDQRRFPRNATCDIGAFETQTSATITVSSALDVSGSCTLRDAITSSNSDIAVGGCVAGNNNDSIVFDDTVFPPTATTTITLAGYTLPPISSHTTITGQGLGGPVIDFAGSNRHFYINGGVAVLNNLILTGAGPSAPPIRAASAEVTLNNSTVSGNSASSSQGGGIYLKSQSKMLLNNSTVSDNSASSGGGVLSRSSQLTVVNSTITGNTVVGRGGGIYSNQNSDASITNSTITGNSAGQLGGGVAASSGRVYLTNNIIAGNQAPIRVEISNINGAATFSSFYNLLGNSGIANADAFSLFTPSMSDITATSDGLVPTDLADILSPLADNGGPTLTHALPAGSPAIDTGDDHTCIAAPVNSLDQRGELRPDGDVCDIGAFEGVELVEEAQTFVVPIPGGKAVIFSL